MTHKAREVLADCEIAFEMLETETDPQRWRIMWAASVALIRAVGHVLHKVDGRNEKIKTAAGDAFRRWCSNDPDHIIFRDFIEAERNNLLKEYRSDVHPLATVSAALEVTLMSSDGEKSLSVRDILEFDENIFRPMVDGPYEGEDARDVLKMAIDWWHTQLNSVDTAILAPSK